MNYETIAAFPEIRNKDFIDFDPLDDKDEFSAVPKIGPLLFKDGTIYEG